MKKNVLLVPFIAAMALLFVGMVSAAELATSVGTEFNGVLLSSGTTMTGDVSSTVPVRVTFNAIENMSDVKINVRMEGHREEISASTSRFDIVYGQTYTKLLNLKLPSDADDLTSKYTLYVEIVSKSDRTEKEYTVSMQRESYTFQILAVDYTSEVVGGDVVPVSVVMKNTGYNRADDIFVIASIPELGISSRGYFGDLIPVEDYIDYDDEEDSASKVVYLRIPENAQSGVYDLEVMVYNKDSEAMTRRPIAVKTSASSMALAAVKNKDLSAGETIEYELILVNSGNNVRVYTLNAVSGDDLKVSVPAVVTVGPASSQNVKILVSADSDAKVGTYTFSVDVDGEQIVFGANVTKETVSTSVVALTVILIIIFVVLLAVLIILLTRKEKPAEEVETSYY